ncbi:protein of unknown function [Ruminococcus sp. YE71]|uniref:DUF4321 domain-containing protein n=1 Tax=unclassified Ruminococcus TaxID=2608920 RepID=UPI000883D8B6|nr:MULTISPECIES: DUF4321 domain-containing protein [unclassified Ruminococcus]SDA15377.1 protein of unknown function [Ruminococcus sp. YE78]SFW22433.1 protein of unknown function [Ruminococcus sp. YE71]
MKKTIAFIFFTLAAVVLGAFLAYLCDGVKYLGWLAWGKTLGLDSLSFDLYVISLSFSLTVRFTISQLITVPIGLIVYAKTSKGLG